MRRLFYRTACSATLIVCALLLPLVVWAQEEGNALELGPKLRPGEVPLDTSVLEPINILIDWGGYDDGKVIAGDAILVEYEEFVREWRPTGQVRWMSIGGAWAAYDLMLVDRETFRIIVRHEPRPGGDIAIRNWGPDSATGAVLRLDGSVNTWAHEHDGPVFDIASLPLMFASVRWEEIDRFQIPMGRREGEGTVPDGGVDWYRIINRGRTTYADFDGTEHQVWRIEIANYAGNRSVEYYVDSRPPYWFGMIAHDEEGTPTSVLRVRGYQMRTTSLSDFVEQEMQERPGDQ